MSFDKASCKDYNENYSGGRLPLPSWRRLHSAKRKNLASCQFYLFDAALNNFRYNLALICQKNFNRRLRYELATAKFFHLAIENYTAL